MGQSVSQEPVLPLAIASVILGVFSVALLGAVTGVPAVICGHRAMSKLREMEQSLISRRVAAGGLFLGYLGIAWSVFVGGILLLGIYYPDLFRALHPYSPGLLF